MEENIPTFIIPAPYFLMGLFTAGNSLMNLLREQYELSKRANISIDFSDNMPEFEREAYINMIIKDLKDEAEHAQKMAYAKKGKSFIPA